MCRSPGPRAHHSQTPRSNTSTPTPGSCWPWTGSGPRAVAAGLSAAAGLSVAAAVTNPYLIQGPASISFSGGRTSGYLLRQIVDAHGGQLPDNVVVTFANTGKEREETLRFVHDCATHWGVHIHWLEWRAGRPGFEEVGFNSASRAGEPFAALIAQKQFLPNPLTRYCTTTLKVMTMKRFMQRGLGWKRWTNAIGLRHDEGVRVLKALARNDAGKDPFTVTMPLAKAKVTKREVMAFWGAQPFDLQLMPHEGNCDLCFLKADRYLREIIRSDPSLADWWIGQEAKIAEPFRKYGATTYATLKADVQASPQFDFGDATDDEFDTECGDLCG